MKKLTFALTFVLLLTACGQTPTGTPETTGGETSASVTADPDFEKYGYVAPDIPDSVDYNGAEFGIAYPTWSSYKSYYFADSEIGETVNDACYKRTVAVEEKLGVDIKPYAFGVENDTLSFVEKTVMAGVDDYDLLLTHNYVGVIGILTGGYVMNWNDIGSVDLSKPYYNQNSRKNLEVDGVLPFLSGDFILPDINGLFFNTKMIDSYKLENPYELVKSGKWTLDKLEEMSKAATSDLDGNGVFDDKDQYGFVGCSGWQFISAVTGAGQMMVKRDGGGMEIAIKDERCVDIIDKLQNFFYKSGDAFVWKSSRENDPNNGGTPPVNFADGTSLFYCAPLSYFPFLRESEIDYGVLPFPKYDESQDGYYSLNWAGYMAVMKTARDPEMTGYVVEALSAESCRTVHPAFFNELLGGKIARDPDAVEVLGMMFDDPVCDNGIITSVFKMISAVFMDENAEYVSSVDSQIGGYRQFIDQYVEGCGAMK